MNPPLPRLLLMCLALAFASLWLGCGPEEEAWAPEDSPRALESSDGLEGVDGVDVAEVDEPAPVEAETHSTGGCDWP